MKNGIVIPCFNEANRLNFDAFQKFIDTHKNYILCFVNDGSQDETLNQLLAFKQQSTERILIYNLKENQGKAEAVRTGINHLLENTNVNTVGFLDADLATGFNDYARLISIMNHMDKVMTFGSRKTKDQKDIKRSFFRELASILVGLLIKVIVQIPIRDTQCGAKVFKRKTALNIFSNSFKSRWLFDVEIFIRVRKLFGKQVMNKIEEVGLLSWEEIEGSKITLKDSLKFPLQLLEIGFDYNIKPQIIILNQKISKRALDINQAA